MPALQLVLSHFLLHAPDETLGCWFVSHDFAGSFGLEYSRDAARELKELLRGLPVRIDYEADAVTLRISQKDDVVPALRTIYERLGWATAELEPLEAIVRAHKRPRPKRVASGDAFLIPLGDDVYGMGQVLELSHRAPTVAVFPWVGPAREVETRDPTSARPLSILHLGLDCSLFTGEWPVIGSHRVVHSPSAGVGGKRNAVGSRSFGGDGFVVRLLRAHAGLDDWERGFVDPAYLRTLVLE